MEKKYILVLDEGTTGLRSILFDKKMEVVSQSYRKITSFYPDPIEVEQDPKEIWDKMVDSMRETVAKAEIDVNEIECIGIGIQRGTFTFWNKKTGETLNPFVVWQDVRGRREKVLRNDPVFKERFPKEHAAVMINRNAWARLSVVINEDPELKAKLQDEDTTYGTIDSWLIYNLTGGKENRMCASHAGTLPMYDPVNRTWKYDVLEYIGIPRTALPEVLKDSDFYGMAVKDILGVEIPIYSAAADQQSALFAEFCHIPGQAKLTIGTGAFLDMNVGDAPVTPPPGFSCLQAWRLGEESTFMVEGSVFTSGTCLEWGKSVGIIEDFGKMDELAYTVEDTKGVYFVPTVNGMDGVPFFDPKGTSSFMGITAGVTRAHMVRAMVESLGFAMSMVFDQLTANMEGVNLTAVHINGGVSRSSLLCQTLADMTGATIQRERNAETTALGAAELAGIYAGWMTKADVGNFIDIKDTFTPSENAENTKKRFKAWLKAVERSKDWLED